MAQEAIHQIKDFSQQNLANLTWAFGKLHHYHKNLLTEVAGQTVLKLAVKPSSSPLPSPLLPCPANGWVGQTMSPKLLQAGCSFAFAFALRFSQSAKGCFEKHNIVASGVQQVVQWDNCVSDYLRLVGYNPAHVPGLNCQYVQTFSLQHISNVMVAFATFLFLPPGLINSVVTEVEKRLTKETFNAQQLSNLIWALSISEVKFKFLDDYWQSQMRIYLHSKELHVLICRCYFFSGMI